MIADSTAFRDDDRVLPQHQAVLTLLQGWLSNPKLQSLRWLDLACGRGQMLTGIQGALPISARRKIDYVGFDIRHDYAQETEALASTLGFRAHAVRIARLFDFPSLYDLSSRFDFITLTNTVHEVEPAQLGVLLVESVARLTDSGCLFVYDMERIRPPELGAVPWTAGEITRILKSLLLGLGVEIYEPAVGRWRHRTCDGWNAQIYRDHLQVSDLDLSARRLHAVKETAAVIVELLRAKRATCIDALNNLTDHAAEVADEQSEKERLLYEFWAVNRALEIAK